MSIRKTKIICTIGPATAEPEILKRMILGGMDVVRINFSHGTDAEHLATADNVKKLRQELRRPIALLLDTKGPEIRTKTLKEGKVALVAGQEFTLTTRDVPGASAIVSITYDLLPTRVSANTRILLDDGLIELIVRETTPTDIICRVQNGGILADRKSINLPGTSIDMPYLDEQDQADLKFAYDNDFDYIAMSFVRSASDVHTVKDYLAGLGPPRCSLIAKIENSEGVDNIDQILSEVDGIMVARGDLGVEIPFEDLPAVQKTLIRKCREAGKMVITATQMLDSMIRNPRPTRAEVSDIANAIFDGTCAIMLSGETSTGQYPIESLETMAKIALKNEALIGYRGRLSDYSESIENNITNAISHATYTTAYDLRAKAIVAVTASGNTARMISHFRPEATIVAITPDIRTYSKLALSWGVIPLLSKFDETPDELFRTAAAKTQNAGLAKDGDIIIVTGSSAFHANVTNTLRVQILSDP